MASGAEWQLVLFLAHCSAGDRGFVITTQSACSHLLLPGESSGEPRLVFTWALTGARPALSDYYLFPDNFHQRPFPPSAVELAVKNLFPGAEIEFPIGD